MTRPLLEAEAIECGYAADEPVLKGISLSITAGERVALLGSNGAGKSTLLLLLAGLLPVRNGVLRLDGDAVKGRDGMRRLRRACGLLLQDPDDQIFASTVEQDVAFGLVQRDVPEQTAFAAAGEALSRLGIGNLAGRQVRSLSLGQRKRLVLAGLVVLKPALLLLDEPTAGLDHSAIEALAGVLDDLQRDGTTVLLATHDTDFAARWASRAIVLDDGRLAGEGPVGDVLSDPAILARSGLPIPTTYAAALALIDVYPRCRQRPLPRTIEELRQFIERLRTATDGGGRILAGPNDGGAHS
jgi:cobalt/nickel transport system ATP-binding protein